MEKKKGSIKREHVRNKLVFKMVKGPAVGRQEGIKGNKVKNSSLVDHRVGNQLLK